MRFYSRSTKYPGIITFFIMLVLSSLTVTAQVFSSASGNITIPDGTNAPLCTNPGGYVCKDIVVSGLPANASLLSASVTLIDHAHIGSLDIEVRAPGGSPTFLPVSRAGATSPTDCGYLGDLEGVYTFQNAASGDLWTTASTVPTNQIVSPGTYFPSFPGGGPAPPAGTPNNALTQTFAGFTNGMWQICARDWGANGGGRLQLASLNFIVPTAAPVTISGRVLTNGGTGIRNAVVTLEGGNLSTPLRVNSTSFGYYNFKGVPVGGTYIISVQAKRFTFNNPTQILNVQDNVGDINFIGFEN